VKAREVSCLGLVVAAIAAATLFTHELNNETQELVVSVPKIVITDAIQTQPETDQHINTKQKEQHPLSQNSIEVEFENREEVIENLQSKFRLLETQYGILSIDDIAISSLIIPTASLAEPFIPQSNDTVIARWSTKEGPSKNKIDSVDQAIKTSENLLARANQPGRSGLYSLADSSLSPWLKKDTENALLWITWARIQQQKHDFDGAIESLNNALKLEPKNINAHLIMARIHVIQQRFELANKSCIELINSGDLLAGSICKFEVASHQGLLKESYDSLKRLVSSLPETNSKKAWAISNLSEMAARQELWQEREAWLDLIYTENDIREREAWLDLIYTENDISILVDWADAKLKLKKYHEVSNKLSAIVERAPSSEDAILIKLALAEKHLNNNETNIWKQRVKKRIELREKRGDLYHASDLAIYYLDIEPNSQKALKWAEINWQQAREYKDETLLIRARNSLAES